MYQPDPLKTMPTGWNTRRVSCPQSGHSSIGESLNFWTASNWCAQDVQRYAYVGMDSGLQVRTRDTQKPAARAVLN
jgi:hypothetical protein